MSRDIESRLKSVALAYSRLARSLPEPLGSQAKSLTKALAPGCRNLVAYYGAREAYPLLRFPLWLEDKYVREGLISYRKGWGAKTATAALFGYLYIRIQDNVLDEPDQFDSAYLLLSNEFIREFFGIYHGLFPPGSPFWGYMLGFWRGTSNNTLWERNACVGRLTGFRVGDLAKIGGKLDGAKTSIASLCILADRENDIEQLTRVMDCINISSQLHNDVVSFVKDLKNRYFTSVIINTLGEAEGAARPDEVFRKAAIRALTGEHLEAALTRAMQYNERARVLMGPGELPGLDEYVVLKNSYLEKLSLDLQDIKKGLLSI